jgi:serine/threonine protein kinase
MAKKWQIGEKLQDRWLIHKILKGGMGVVYVVYDDEWHEAFAAKTYQDTIFTYHPLIAERFEQEVNAWMKLDVHQNITQARFFQGIEGKPFIFLEYVSGGDLGNWIGTPRLTEDLGQVLRFGIQFCDGMCHALLKGIKVHRDIKPQNCLITENGTLKITDFGLAKLFDDTNGDSVFQFNPTNLYIGCTLTGQAAGTPTHMAPEQFDDSKHVDVRADIYSFGVILFQMVTGNLPFSGQSWSDFEHLHKTQSPPLEIIDHKSLASIIHTCLAKDPTKRYADFMTVRGHLVEIYEEQTGEPAPQPAKGPKLDAIQSKFKGWSLVNLGHFREALTYYDRAIDLNPEDGEAWYNKGNTLHRLEQANEALICYDRAIKINPEDEDMWNNKGSTLRELGRYQEALVCFDHAIKINPNFEKVWNNKGNLLADMGCQIEAITCYDRAIEINPNYERAWYNKGVTLNELGRWSEASLCFEKAHRLSSH